jgi:hypothetical protein
LRYLQSVGADLAKFVTLRTTRRSNAFEHGPSPAHWYILFNRPPPAPSAFGGAPGRRFLLRDVAALILHIAVVEAHGRHSRALSLTCQKQVRR